MKVIDLFLRLFEGSFDLFLGKCHEKVIYKFDIALEEFIHSLIASFDVDAQQITLGVLVYRSVDEWLVQED
jgi:hypothetical protein